MTNEERKLLGELRDELIKERVDFEREKEKTKDLSRLNLLGRVNDTLYAYQMVLTELIENTHQDERLPDSTMSEHLEFHKGIPF